MTKQPRRKNRLEQLPVPHEMLHRALALARDRARENGWQEGASLDDIAILSQFFQLDEGTGRVLHRAPDRRFFKARGFSPERAKKQEGEAADTLLVRGQYRRVNLLRQPIAAHVVAYVLASGEVPLDRYVDHLDGDGLNNRPANLIARTPAEAWRVARAAWGDVTPGNRPGVRFRAGMWEAAVFELVPDAFGGCRRNWRKLGRYVTQEQAARAYDAAEAMLEANIASRKQEMIVPGFHRWLEEHLVETRIENERLRLAGIMPRVDG